MGGNALKQYGVTRISHPAYEQRLRQLNAYMENLPEGIECTYFVPGGVVKEDHGDLDVLYYSNDPEKLIQHFKRLFGSVGSKKNGNCHSLEWMGFQVDFIYIRPGAFDFASHYYAHGTYAALLGKLARYYGFKLGWQGLHFVVKTKHREHTEEITLDWDEAVSILGYETVLDPKATLPVEELYEHLISSKLIHKRIYKSSKPDRNYGFQEEFFEWIDIQAQVADNGKSRAYGWCLITKRKPTMGVRLLHKHGRMILADWAQPLRRKYRKLRFVHVEPFLYKCRGWL